MIRHVVLLELDDRASPAHVESTVAALRELPSQIPEIADYHVGVDAGLADGNADLVVIAEFAEPEGWRAYRDHPAHRRVIDDFIAPVLARRTAIQSTT